MNRNNKTKQKNINKQAFIWYGKNTLILFSIPSHSFPLRRHWHRVIHFTLFQCVPILLRFYFVVHFVSMYRENIYRSSLWLSLCCLLLFYFSSFFFFVAFQVEYYAWLLTLIAAMFIYLHFLIAFTSFNAHFFFSR